MSNTIYAHDGTNWRSVNEMYCYAVSGWVRVVQAYAHDGTAWRLVHDKNKWTKLGTLTDCVDVIDAGGTIYAASGASIYSWDGSTWNIVGSAIPYNVRRLFYDGSFAYASTDDHGLYRYSGGLWSAFGAQPPYSANSFTTLSGVSYQADDYYGAVYILGSSRVGAFNNPLGGITNDGTNLIAGMSDGVKYYNGSSWVEYGSMGSVYSVVYSGGTLYANFSTAATTVRSWDGSAWNDIGATVPISAPKLYDCNGVLHAVGTSGIFSWDGTSWVELMILRPQIRRPVISYISGAIYAASYTGVYRWDGP